MMPKKPPEEKRSHIIGVKVDEETKEKINYLAGMNGKKASTYIYNILRNHIAELEPWITNEIRELTRKEN